MFIVITRSGVINTSSGFENLDRLEFVLDLDDLIIETVTLRKLVSILDMIGTDSFLNVSNTDDGYCIESCVCLGEHNISTGDWVLCKNKTKFRGSPVELFPHSGEIYLRICNNKYKLGKYNYDNFSYYLQYIETLKERRDVYVLHYLVRITHLIVIIDSDGRPLIVFDNKRIIEPYICDKSIERLITKFSVIKGKGWWSYLRKR